MTIETASAWVMLIALIVYALFGGADFGAGVWDLLASGPRKKEQRELISHAIGPIWEANHVWMILVVVMMFTCFPPAFAAMMTALHVPLTLVLLGIVARGSSFTFRAYGGGDALAEKRWGLVFSIASIATPLLLGVSLGTIASGTLQWEGDVYVSGFFAPWMRLFPWAVGCFVLSIFSFLAVVFLCVEAAGELREDFRKRALVAGIMVGVFAAVTWVLASRGAPLLSSRLSGDWWAIPLQIVTGVAAVGALVSLWRRKFALARMFAVAQVTLIVLGYGAALFPYLVVPQITIENSAAPRRTHELVLGAIGVGALILIPSLAYLFRMFKGERAFALLDDDKS